MVVKILVPSLGESVSEATVGKWLKKIGDFINSDEALLELETDKVAIEVPSPVSGILSEISIEEGQMVKPGGFLGYIEESSSVEIDLSKNPVQSSHESSKTSTVSYQMPQSPSAAKMMAENAVGVLDVKGTGKRGQILKSDVVSALSTHVAPTVPCKDSFESKATASEERIKMSRLRQIIAKRLKDAQNTAAILTTYNEVDMSRILVIRNRYKDLFEKKYGVKLGFMGFFTKAICQALQEIRGINAEIDGENIVYKNYCNIGVAVGTEKGLVVPVIRHADQMSLAEIEMSISRLAKLAREGKLSVDDLRDGTFTISNGGVYGSLLSSPILNPPQSGIFGMHKIQERAVVENGQIVARPMMYIALSYDHRIVDGKESVMFLVRVKEYLEYPERFILGI